MKSFCRKVIQRSYSFFAYTAFMILISIILAGCNNYLIELKECVTNIEVSYTVEHYQQTVDARTYEKITDDVESLKGVSLSKTEAQAKDYEGFTAKTIEQQTINRDGSTVVKIYYDRNNITYTFTADGGDWEGNSGDKTTSGLYGAAVVMPSNPSKTGYTFASWNQTVPQVFGSQNTTFTAKWAAGTGTLYKVEHLLQDTTGTSYEVLAQDEQTFTGTTGAQTAAQAKEYTGFTAKEVTQQSIAADGSTVVNICYDRNTITYTFNADGGNWNGSTVDVVVEGRFGAAVSAPVEGLQKTGYTFVQWNNTVPSIFGASNLSFTAGWAANTDTVYKVEHWQQNVDDDEYTMIAEDTQSLTGTTEGQTVASAKAYAGFTAKPFTQGVIAPDGSTVVKVYYDRNLITYRFSGGGGKWENNIGIQTLDGRFGTTVIIPANPVLTGYTFAHWDNTVPQTFGASDLLFTASWAANTDTAYKVEHWQQNVDDDEYTIVQEDTQNLYGTTGEQTTACSKTYNGFTAQDFSQNAIAPDGTTVVRINYNRNIIKYTFNSGNGKFNNDSTSIEVSGRYGATVSKPANPTRIGYTFNAWNDTVPSLFGLFEETFTALWNINSYTVYFNSNGGSAIASQTTEYNTTITTPNTPEKNNYSFVGWYNNTGLTNQFSFNTPITEDITLYAKWQYEGQLVNNGIVINGKIFEKTAEVYVITSPYTITNGGCPAWIPSEALDVFKGSWFLEDQVIQPFIMSKYEVTQELYEAVMANKIECGQNLNPNPSRFKTEDYLVAGETQRLRPVESVSWFDAVYFCNALTEMVGNGLTPFYDITVETVNSNGNITKVSIKHNNNATGYRLPYSKEWEFAARGGNSDSEDWNYLFSGADGENGLEYNSEQNRGLDAVGWYRYNITNGGLTGDSFESGSPGYGTHEVGKKLPNALGLYDMSGNVSEWTDGVTGLLTDNTGYIPSSAYTGIFYVFRGGSYSSPAFRCTPYFKLSSHPESRATDKGFRVVRSIYSE